jgi:hypothetical protein
MGKSLLGAVPGLKTGLEICDFSARLASFVTGRLIFCEKIPGNFGNCERIQR